MRELVRTSEYIVTVHAAEEIEADELTIFDVEHAVLTGEIIERQKDEQTGQWKYVIEGVDLGGEPLRVVGRISRAAKLVFITVFGLEQG
ncbi:MAG: DUF4258 domain-containing protein [Phycisphaerae bacterium]|nr:MAG: DUF4258 domain-containing protein [Planctomycetota bacterium]KAB2946509.1 MAG: DUF4258 domain-containing protein [Phycisphaerae bacterium]MBE7456676.1 DUF4258 domain-containing protein [Planctomycetia bacterium]MCL4718159.1 DUF4258 domain-containing protein [Phycisphaerae bacterium]NUQ07975.1 DUF4258 domain-containing protein [Phycisphaerae bacterium]